MFMFSFDFQARRGTCLAWSDLGLAMAQESTNVDAERYPGRCRDWLREEGGSSDICVDVSSRLTVVRNV